MRDRLIEVVGDIIKDQVKENRELEQAEIDSISEALGDSDGVIQELIDDEDNAEEKNNDEEAEQELVPEPDKER